MNFYLNLDNTKVLSRLRGRNCLAENKLFRLLSYGCGNVEFKGIYFGQEFCSELIPHLNDIKNIVHFSLENNLDFIYITGPTGQRDIQKIKRNLKYINNIKKKTEVVVNEWGILKIINREFCNLVPVVGRLLIKNRRMAHFDSAPSPSLNHIDTPIDKITLTQRETLLKTNLDVKEYVDFLKKYNVSRVSLDFIRTGLDLKHIKDFEIDIYASHAYITGGRLCRLACILEPKRNGYVVNKPCKRYCNEYKIELVPNFDNKIFYKYNSIFLRHDEKRIIKFIDDNKRIIDRVILEYS